jgi:hypothetical protein
MKKLLLFFALPLASFLTLSAQITQQEADSIALHHLLCDEYIFELFAMEEMQADGFIFYSSIGENLKFSYPCWVYYVQHSLHPKKNGNYLIVKESNGNILEINANNDEGPDNLEEWRNVDSESACERELFYYYNNQKIFLGEFLQNNFLVIGYENNVQDEDLINYLVQTGLFEPEDMIMIHSGSFILT